jgi:hypothetical protein
VKEGWDSLGYEHPTPSVLMLSPTHQKKIKIAINMNESKTSSQKITCFSAAQKDKLLEVLKEKKSFTPNEGLRGSGWGTQFSPAQCVLVENIQHSYQLVVVKPRAQHRHATVLSSDIFSLLRMKNNDTPSTFVR